MTKEQAIGLIEDIIVFKHPPNDLAVDALYMAIDALHDCVLRKDGSCSVLRQYDYCGSDCPFFRSKAEYDDSVAYAKARCKRLKIPYGKAAIGG